MKVFVATLALLAVANAMEFEIRNNEIGDVWIGIQGNPNKEHLHNGGFVLGPGQSVTVGAAEDWAGRFWARTWCDPNSNHCETGDCGNRLECAGAGGTPPVSLAEITLKGAGGLDFYDISLVDGFNLKISMEPIGGSGDGGQYSCKKCACDYEFKNDCPPELQQTSPNGVLACKSACLAFDTDEYCCRGDHGLPETCKSSDWPVDYPAHFKSHCPDAYSYAYDDHKSTFTCRAEKYIVTFG